MNKKQITKQVAEVLNPPTFSDLKFNNHPLKLSSHAQSIIFFDNGYGASVVKGAMFYTDNTHPYELAVLEGNKNKWSLPYDTPITTDVLGHCNEQEITKLLLVIKNLPNHETN